MGEGKESSEVAYSQGHVSALVQLGGTGVYCIISLCSRYLVSIFFCVYIILQKSTKMKMSN